ncbi:MAG: signal recognition particle-docking protein FtsY [Hyphomicrobium sp.]|nr:signal recognition particle-docking protein FtsY [Hyphomicrobium sp.]
MSEQDGKRKGLFGRLFGSKAETPRPADDVAIDADTQNAVPSDDAVQIADGRSELASDDKGAASVAPVAVEEIATSDAVAAVEAAVPEVPAIPEVRSTPVVEPKLGWFQKLKAGLGKTSAKLSDGITGIFTKRKLDAATLDDLEDLLIQSDIGLPTATRITAAISKGRFEKGISADDVRTILSEEVERVLSPVAKPLSVTGSHKPHVIMMVGVNGTGKTTTIGKLAAKLKCDGKVVVLAAGDTFRAAAIDQLKVWGQRTSSPVVARAVGSDSSGLAFDALKEAQNTGADVLLLDTAGRLQNKQALMEELEKVIRVLKKLDSTAPHDVVLVLDATTGQNALGQVEAFREKAGVTGLVMTKLDGTARGGILVAIAEKFALPVHAIGVGEGIDDLLPFEAKDFARAIANS